MESSFYDRAGQTTRICDKRQQILHQNHQGLIYGFISENFYARLLALEREESRRYLPLAFNFTTRKILL